MSMARSITDLRISGSSFLRGSRQARRRGLGTLGRPLKNRSRALPRLELLEERMMLTTFFVNSNADTSTGTGTTGTLRYVLYQLPLMGTSSNIISFASLPAADFTFTPGSALPTITKQVTIEGLYRAGFLRGAADPDLGRLGEKWCKRPGVHRWLHGFSRREPGDQRICWRRH
jgi:hypothetical protein